MKLTEKWKSTKKRTKVCIIVLPIVVIAAVAAVFVFMKFFGEKKMPEGEWPQMSRMENGMVTATGTTATDMVAKQLDIGSLETTLYVEDVYVSSGDSVAEGDKLLKLTEESVADAHKELRQKATEAEVAYSQQKIKYEESLIEARKSADITLAEGEYADSTYAVELASENRSIADLEEQVAEALKLAEEYYAAVNSDYYYSYYEIDELQKRVAEPFAYLMELYHEWNVENAEYAQQNPSVMASKQTYDPEKYALYQKFDAAVTVIHGKLEEAKENYEADTQKATYSLEAAQAEYELLNAQYEEAVAALEQTKVLLKAECDMAKAEAELAESSYEATVKQLTEELNEISDENDAAQEDLQTFEEMMGDGYLYATEAGSIMMLNARKGNSLDVSMPYLVYSDSSNVTVSVSVDQSYISQISVGDRATVIISELGTYEGTVTSINPVSQSDSRTSVYYSVVVTLEGDVSAVTSNLTASVMFMSGEDSQQPDFNNFEGAQEKGEEAK